MEVLLNIDVPDLERGVAFYTAAFGLSVTRRLGDEVVELGGWPVKLYLLHKAAGSVAAGTQTRLYSRHWTPMHLDVVVDDIAAAQARALAAGAVQEHDIRSEGWGSLALMADPFGHGFCLIEFTDRGYDAMGGTGDS